jgi:hypothetical protein
MNKDVKKYVEKCEKGQRKKSENIMSPRLVTPPQPKMGRNLFGFS